ncbi:hypothetical protein GGR61_001631 [Xanthomonas arboricola]|nr:hypothetical protein [Xanthomonas sp. 3058]
MQFHEISGCRGSVCRCALRLCFQHFDSHLAFRGCGSDERRWRGRCRRRAWQRRDRRRWAGRRGRQWGRNRKWCRDHLGAGSGDRRRIDHAGALLPVDRVVHRHAERLQHHGVEHAQRLCRRLTGGQRHDAADRVDDLAVHGTVVDHGEVAPFWMIKARIWVRAASARTCPRCWLATAFPIASAMESDSARYVAPIAKAGACPSVIAAPVPAVPTRLATLAAGALGSMTGQPQ